MVSLGRKPAIVRGVSTATPAGTLYKIGLRNEMVQDMHR
jgi:hypothetical protein